MKKDKENRKPDSNVINHIAALREIDEPLNWLKVFVTGSNPMKRIFLSFLLLLLIAAAVSKFFLFEIPTVAGEDMAPTLQKGDRLLAVRWGFKPQRGDLVLLEHPETGQLMIRRIIALPGERIGVKQEVPIVNGLPVRRKLIKEVMLSDPSQDLNEARFKLIEEIWNAKAYYLLKDPRRKSRDTKEIELLNGYYVLADNRNYGTDSRTFGPVPETKIRAVIFYRVSTGKGSIKGQPPRQNWMNVRESVDSF